MPRPCGARPVGVDQYPKDAAKLREARAVPVSDDLVLVSLVACQLRRRYVDDGLRYRLVEAQATVVDLVTATLRAAPVCTNELACVIAWCLGLVFCTKQALLVGIEHDLLLRLATEDLPFEPRQLCP
jgi:hypothetical protein